MINENPDYLSSPEKLVSALEISEIGLWEYDLQTKQKIVDKRLVAMLGYQLEEVDLTIKFWNNLIHPDDKERVFTELESYLIGGDEFYNSEYRLRTKQGQWKWILDRGEIAKWDQEGKPLVLFGIHKDIQERKIAEQDLIRERNKLESVVSALGDGLTVQDKNFKIIYQNEIQKKRQGEHKGKYCYVAYQGRDEICDGCLVVKCYTDGQVHRRETFATTSEGKDLFMEVSASPLKDSNGNIVGAVETVRDITSRKLLERQLQQSQKLEAVGTLAGGVAHDFNNILSIMLGYAEIAKMNAPDDSRMIEDLNTILTAGDRAKNLVKQILSFSRQAQVDKTLLKPQPVIKEVLDMIRASLPKSIEIQKNISSADVVIDADPTQLHQVLMNLCVNAFHAMEKNGGVLGVVFKVAESVPSELLEKESQHKSKFVLLSVNDTGQGIGPDYIDKIFDPFFTTKEKGKGTGMGLATIYGIVKNCGGVITVESKLGKGTTFNVYLPIANQVIISSQTEDIVAPQGSERILFIDDEKFLAEMGKDMLERLGYDVTIKQRCIEALEAFQNQPDKFDIVITDQTMPGMTGIDLARRMLQIRPDIPIILCTGYSTLVDENIALNQGIKAFAYKPLSMITIAKLIRKVLDVS